MRYLVLALILAITACSPCTMTPSKVCVGISDKHKIDLEMVEGVTGAVVDYWSRFLPRGAIEQAIANSEVQFVDDEALDSQYGPAWGLTWAKYMKVAWVDNDMFVLGVYAHELAHIIITYVWPGGTYLDNDEQHKLMRQVGFL